MVNPKGPYLSLEKEKTPFCVLFSYSINRAHEIRKFHVAVVQPRLRNMQKSVMHVQICCFANKYGIRGGSATFISICICICVFLSSFTFCFVFFVLILIFICILIFHSVFISIFICVCIFVLPAFAFQSAFHVYQHFQLRFRFCLHLHFAFNSYFFVTSKSKRRVKTPL